MKRLSLPHFYTAFFILVLTAGIFSACNNGQQKKTVKIGFSQGMTTDEWRRQMNKTMQIEASLHPEVRLDIKDAGNSVQKQVQDIEALIESGDDVIIVSPIESRPLTAVIRKSMQKGIPVLAVDRKTDTEDFTAYMGAEQDFISRMNGIIMANMDNPKFSVEELADTLNVSRVQLYRKVKAILGISISDHINNIKLERAAEMLRNGTLNISEVAYALGFSSPNYFSTAFKSKFGISPKEYRTGA